MIKPKCGSCEYLQATYVGDGFDEFYEWRCGAKRSRLIGHDEPFHHCKLPDWCPKLPRKKSSKRKVKKAKIRMTRYDMALR